MTQNSMDLSYKLQADNDNLDHIPSDDGLP
jgi:hypothetical protein